MNVPPPFPLVDYSLTKLASSDGEKGVLLFQGYSIEQLWDCDFEDILHLMLRGDLPSLSQREGFRQ